MDSKCTYVKSNTKYSFAKNSKTYSYSNLSNEVGFFGEAIKSNNSPKFKKPRKLTSFKMYISEEDSLKKVDDYGENLSDSIEGTYSWDYNILDVHNLIVRRFQYKKDKNLATLTQSLSEERNKIKNRQSMIERKRTRKRIQTLENDIEDLKRDNKFKQYINKVKPLIDRYRQIGSLTKMVSFNKSDEYTNKSDKVPETEEEQIFRHRIISNYLDIAKKYIKIDVVRRIDIDNICSGCRNKLDENAEIDKTGITVCKLCGTERIPITVSPFFKNTTRVNTSRNNYEDRDNFYKVILRYQGKQINKPNSSVYDKLDRYFESIDFPSSNEIKLLRKNKYSDNNTNNEKDKTSRQLMYEALRKTGNSNQYDHINLICHVYWGWELPDISHLESQVMNDYDISQKIYDSLPKDRKSSLNSQFRLYKHLRRLGYFCKESDFKIPTTQDIREFHEITWSTICDIAGWENV